MRFDQCSEVLFARPGEEWVSAMTVYSSFDTTLDRDIPAAAGEHQDIVDLLRAE